MLNQCRFPGSNIGAVVGAFAIGISTRVIVGAWNGTCLNVQSIKDFFHCAMPLLGNQDPQWDWRMWKRLATHEFTPPLAWQHSCTADWGEEGSDQNLQFIIEFMVHVSNNRYSPVYFGNMDNYSMSKHWKDIRITLSTQSSNVSILLPPPPNIPGTRTVIVFNQFLSG